MENHLDFKRVVFFRFFALSACFLYMALVKINEKYQVILPAARREKVGSKVGDLLEAKVQGKVIASNAVV